MAQSTGPAWLHDYDQALARAKEEGKLVLLDVFNPG